MKIQNNMVFGKRKETLEK